MDPLVILSPHLDDAVLSCGQLLADRAECVVVTLFAGGPSRASTTLTTYDRKCGFTNAHDAMEARRREDLDALASFEMGHRAVHLGCVDHGYGAAARCDYGEAANDVVRALGEVGHVEQIAGPLGLAHPDHHATAEVLRRVAWFHRPDLQAWAYEDLPARVLYPDEVAQRVGWWRAMGFDPTAAHGQLGVGGLAVKAAAMARYRSQLRALEEHGQHAVLCPERLWRLWRAGS